MCVIADLGLKPEAIVTRLLRSQSQWTAWLDLFAIVRVRFP